MECSFDGCERGAISKGYCDKHYRRLLKRGDVNNYGSRKVAEGDAIERFHKKYEINKSGCWLWTGGTRPNSKGVLYPRHWTNESKSIGAHRFSFELVHGAIPQGMYVCHKCDTPLCVNPDHLFLGSHQDNMRDMVVKKRSFVGRGEDKKGRAKLTNQQADQIRKMEISQSKIAALFGVSQTTIGRIKRGESY
jgi:predicted XRE-type DNA-binding protein